MTTPRRIIPGLVLLALVLGACSSTAPDAADAPSVRAAAAACPSTAAGPGRSEVTVRSDGRDRSYLRYVPRRSGRSSPAPLVVDLTAYSPATLEESFSGFTKPDDEGSVKADEVGAVVVTPEPVNGKGLLTWNVEHTKGWTDDQRFIVDLIDDVESHACVDPKRVLVMGFVIGGVMASTVACEHPDLVTAIATVSGLWDPPGCKPPHPVPVVSLHGNDDHFLPYDGGVGDRIGMLGLSAETTAGLTSMATRPGAVAASSAWAARDGCGASPDDEAVAPGVERTSWAGCDGDVQLYTITGGGHTWPGSNGMGTYAALLGTVSKSVDANDVIWSFFRRHWPS